MTTMLTIPGTYTTADGSADGLVHQVPDGQMQSDNMSSLCGIVLGDGEWSLSMDVEMYVAPQCPACRTVQRGEQ